MAPGNIDIMSLGSLSVYIHKLHQISKQLSVLTFIHKSLLKDEGRDRGMVIGQIKGMGMPCGKLRDGGKVMKDKDGCKYAKNIFPETRILCLH